MPTAIAQQATSAGSKDETVCVGDWVEAHGGIGLLVGICMLHELSDEDKRQIKEVCGEPWSATVEIEPTPRCRVVLSKELTVLKVNKLRSK